MKSSHAVGCGLSVIALFAVLIMVDQFLPTGAGHSPVGRAFLRLLHLTGMGPSHPGSGPTSVISRVRSQMVNLKTGLVCYQNDLGKPPFVGAALSSTSLDLADTHCLGTTFARNVLVSDTISKPFENLGMPIHLYRKRWKGPYMDDDPAVFMTDPWGRKIIYAFASNAVYLHCGGPDGIRDPLGIVLTPGYAGDDITMIISKLKMPKAEATGSLPWPPPPGSASEAASAAGTGETPATPFSSGAAPASRTVAPDNP